MNVEKTKLFALATKDEKAVKTDIIVNDILRTSARFDLNLIEESVTLSELERDLDSISSTFPLDFDAIIDLERNIDLANDKIKRLNKLKTRLFKEA